MRKQWITAVIVLGLALFMGASPASAQLPANLLLLLQQLAAQQQPQQPQAPPTPQCKQQMLLTPILPPLGGAVAGQTATAEKRHQLTQQKFEVDVTAAALVPYSVMVTTKSNSVPKTVGGLFTNQFGFGEFDVDGRPQKPLFGEPCDVQIVLVFNAVNGKVIFAGDFGNPLNNNNQVQIEIEDPQMQLEIQNELELELNNILDN